MLSVLLASLQGEEAKKELSVPLLPNPFNELTNLIHFPQVSLSIKRLIKMATTLDK
jgi:hypothetical protein